MMIQTRLVVFAILVIVVPALVMVITVVMIVGVSRLFSLHLIRLRRHPMVVAGSMTLQCKQINATAPFRQCRRYVNRSNAAWSPTDKVC